MDTHHDSSAGASAVAGWMGALVFLIVAMILLIFLLVWAPWNDGDSNVTPDTGTEEGTDGGGGQPQPSQ